MANVHDVAAYVTDHFDSTISTMKLQKLCYIAQGWSLALRDQTLFADDFQAWANGPVCWTLFDKHRGQYSVGSWEWGNADNLRRDEKIILDGVLRNYEALSGRQLSALTHQAGTPWTQTRQRIGASVGSRASEAIPNDLIKAHYRQALVVPAPSSSSN